MDRTTGVESVTVRTINGLIGEFKARVADVRKRNQAHYDAEKSYFSAQEQRLVRAVTILEKAGNASDSCYRVYSPAAIDHIESLAWEISGILISDNISALEINPLVLFLK